MIKTKLYTVQRVKNDESLYGKVHYSSEGDETHCGKKLDHNWYILTNDFTGVANCPVCNATHCETEGQRTTKGRKL
jgi:hypothetical protein